jgi:hypothetical protein
MSKNIQESLTVGQAKKNYFILNMLRSKYCLVVLIVGLAGGYYFVPKKIFNGIWFVVGIAYIIVFAFVIACMTRVIKERAVNMKNTGASLISVIATVIGIGAMQTCGIGAPICGATVGVGIFSLFFPNISKSFLTEYSLHIIIASIVIQLVALYYMNCFKECLANKIRKNNKHKADEEVLLPT